MFEITNQDFLNQVAGGEEVVGDVLGSGSSGSGGIGGSAPGGGGDYQTVEITGTQAQVMQAKEDYATAQSLAGLVSVSAGVGAGLVVNGACTGGAALAGGLLGGAGAAATVVAARPACNWAGGAVAGGVGTYVNYQLNKYINDNF